MMNLHDLREAIDRYRPGFDAPKECLIHSKGQIHALMEHVERGESVDPYWSLPVRVDESVPPGVLRYVRVDGDFIDYRIA